MALQPERELLYTDNKHQQTKPQTVLCCLLLL